MKKMKIKEEHKQKCGSIGTCEENRRVFVLNNANDFYKVQIDGGVIPRGKEPKCCDYYFFKEKEIEIFVELKGSDVKNAFLQIEQSIKNFSYKYPQKYAVIISSKVPKCTSEQRAMENFRKSNNNVKLKVKTKQLECEYILEKQDIKFL